eukprot:1056552-Amphidinium_carterae.1
MESLWGVQAVSISELKQVTSIGIQMVVVFHGGVTGVTPDGLTVAQQDSTIATLCAKLEFCSCNAVALPICGQDGTTSSRHSCQQALADNHADPLTLASVGQYLGMHHELSVDLSSSWICALNSRLKNSQNDSRAKTGDPTDQGSVLPYSFVPCSQQFNFMVGAQPALLHDGLESLEEGRSSSSISMHSKPEFNVDADKHVPHHERHLLELSNSGKADVVRKESDELSLRGDNDPHLAELADMRELALQYISDLEDFMESVSNSTDLDKAETNIALQRSAVALEKCMIDVLKFSPSQLLSSASMDASCP